MSCSRGLSTRTPWGCCRPCLRSRATGRKSCPTFPGSPPDLIGLPQGCPYAPRCPYVRDACHAMVPDLADRGAGHPVRCIVDLNDRRVALSASAQATPATSARSNGALLDVKHLVKYFPVTRGALLRRHAGWVRAVDDVSFSIEAGETLGLVGRVRLRQDPRPATAVMQLEVPTSGEVVFEGQTLTSLKRDEQRRARRRMQMIFQDPYGSLNPRMSVGKIIEEPMMVPQAVCEPPGSEGSRTGNLGACWAQSFAGVAISA